MRDLLRQFDKVFESRIRLALMSILMAGDAVEFQTLKRLLNVTDGNLATHAATLEKHRYLTVRKSFRGKKTLTTFSATAEGRRAFGRHLSALGRLINNVP